MQSLFEIVNCDQGSEEWLKERLGLLTASSFSKITTAKTLKRSVSHDALVNKAVGEKITGLVEEGFKSEAMQRGTNMEDESFDFVNFAFNHDFKKVGFLKSMDIAIGASPDGIDFDKQIGLELKNPILSTHIGYLLKGDLPPIYFPQIQGSLLVTGFEIWIFCSYYPGIKPLYLEVKRDERYINCLREDLKYCCSEIKRRYDLLR